MSWTTPIDPPADGNAITRAFFMTYVKDNLTQLRAVTGGDPSGAGQVLVSTGAGVANWAAQPACRVYNSTNISIPGVNITVLTFDSERYDTGGLHSTSSNTSRLTCVVPGKYRIFGHCEYTQNGTGIRGLHIYVNGSLSIAETYVSAISTAHQGMTATTEYALAAGDYVELVAYQSSGGNLDVRAVGNHTPEFGMSWICP